MSEHNIAYKLRIIAGTRPDPNLGDMLTSLKKSAFVTSKGGGMRFNALGDTITCEVERPEDKDLRKYAEQLAAEHPSYEFLFEETDPKTPASGRITVWRNGTLAFERKDRVVPAARTYDPVTVKAIVADLTGQGYINMAADIHERFDY